MSRISIDVRMDSGATQDAFGRLERQMRDTTPIMREIAKGLRDNTISRIEREVDPQGRPWTPLNPVYASTKRGPGMLREGGYRGGGLLTSFEIDATRGSAFLWNIAPYARIHQLGGVIRPKEPGGRLRFSMGGRDVFASSVTIPARPFLGIGPEDEEMALDVVQAALEGAIVSNGGGGRFGGFGRWLRRFFGR